MRWGDYRRSENVEDRTGNAPEGGGGGLPFGGMRLGGGALIIVVIVGMLFGINPFEMLGMLGGGLMGGPLAAIGKLQAAGLNMEQIKVLGTTTLDYAKQKAGADLVRQVAGSIPGLGSYV